jgi:hypothetical protein
MILFQKVANIPAALQRKITAAKEDQIIITLRSRKRLLNEKEYCLRLREPPLIHGYSLVGKKNILTADRIKLVDGDFGIYVNKK